jgi:hypothetical protein
VLRGRAQGARCPRAVAACNGRLDPIVPASLRAHRRSRLRLPRSPDRAARGRYVGAPHGDRARAAQHRRGGSHRRPRSLRAVRVPAGHFHLEGSPAGAPRRTEPRGLAPDRASGVAPRQASGTGRRHLAGLARRVRTRSPGSPASSFRSRPAGSASARPCWSASSSSRWEAAPP